SAEEISIGSMETLKNPFLSLANELIEKIIHYLSMEDRANLGEINDRLRIIERNAGYRRLMKIEISDMKHNGIVIRDGSNSSYKDFPINEIVRNDSSFAGIASYFKNASTQELLIKGHIDEERQRMVQLALKTVTFQKLIIAVTDQYSISIINDLLINRRSLKELEIQWKNGIGINVERARKMILELPSLEKFTLIATESRVLLVNEDSFLHLV
ncbi:hypothetical protein PENTCL1PPCAC_6033, partial [Pristionchus entomophagus]